MDLTLLGDRALAPRAIHRNFLFMTICFAVNHGCVISVLNLSVVLLGTEPGAFQTGSLYVTYAASALLFATPLLDALGSRRALVYASATYCVYVASVPLAMVVRAPWGLYVISCVGGAVGGVAAGFLWAAQGAYFSASAQLYAAAVAADGGSVAPSASPPAAAVEGATSSLAAWFGAVFLACEVALKLLPLLLSAIPALNGEVVVGGGKSLRVGDVVVGGVYSILAIAAAVLMARVWDVDKLKQEQQASAAPPPPPPRRPAAPPPGRRRRTTTALRQPAAGRRWRRSARRRRCTCGRSGRSCCSSRRCRWPSACAPPSSASTSRATRSRWRSPPTKSPPPPASSRRSSRSSPPRCRRRSATSPARWASRW